MTEQEPPTLTEYQGWEIYPMPMFATLAVRDVAATTAWYEAALGFGVVFKAPGPAGQPMLVHLRRRKYQDLLITPSHADHAIAPTSLTVSFNVDGEIDELAARAHAAAPAGASAVRGPVDAPWNTRDLRVTDPAGHELIFTARNPDPDPRNVERMNALFK
jgi:catechol 2,3-dioxygenase-like lactoylglutathione lyase family enzyme